MDNNVRKYLNDVLNSIENIEFFMLSRPKEFTTFCSDRCFRDLD